MSLLVYVLIVYVDKPKSSTLHSEAESPQTILLTFTRPQDSLRLPSFLDVGRLYFLTR